MAISDAFMIAWDALPEGSFFARFEGCRYRVTRTVRNGGRQGWIWAEQLGGPDRISGNVYRLKSGTILKPCEMPISKVVTFVKEVKPDTKPE